MKIKKLVKKKEIEEKKDNKEDLLMTRKYDKEGKIKEE